jgi:protein-S-isoprenylcysteine O-methyltransferase Ste14
LEPGGIGGIIGAGDEHRSRMNQTAKIVVKGANYPIVRFFMWIGLAAGAMAFIALFLSKWAFVIVGLTLLFLRKSLLGDLS